MTSSSFKSPEAGRRAADVGRRAGRNTTHEIEAYDAIAEEVADESAAGVAEEDDPIHPQDLMEPDATGAHLDDGDPFRQKTALFDKGEFLGALADLEDRPPSTRAAQAAAGPPRGFRLIEVAGPELGMEWSFKKLEITIGRDESCDLVLADIAVSRQHARLALEQDRVVIHDLGSGNGTFVNGSRCERHVLAAGDEVTIGERTLRFVELNEPPPTAAAYPAGNRPSVKLGASMVVPKDEPRVELSRVEVALAEGPIAGLASPEALRSAPKKTKPKRGAAIKTMLVMMALAGAVLSALFVGWSRYQKHRRVQEETQREMESRQAFLQAVELVKGRRFGDAVIMLRHVLALRPDHSRAAEYIAHSEREIEIWRVLESSREMMRRGQPREALRALAAIKEESAYVRDARILKGQANQAIADELVGEARKQFEADDMTSALETLDRANYRSPEHGGAAELRRQIERVIAERAQKRARPKPKHVTPPEMERAVDFYVSGEIRAAIDAAQSVGGDVSTKYVERFEELETLYRDARRAHDAKAADELLTLIPRALELDQQAAGGKGRIRERLQSFYADALYMSGLDALQGEDYESAFERFQQAVRQVPEHRLAETQLAQLASRGKDLYWQGYGLKDTDKEAAKAIFLQLIRITRPSNQYRVLAEKLLKELER